MTTPTTRNLIVADSLLLVASIVPFFLDSDQAKYYSPYNFGIIQLLLFVMLFLLQGSERNRFLYSPSFIAVTYVNLNFFIGSIAFLTGSVYDFVLNPYRNWLHMDVMLRYFNIANFVIINSYFVSKRIAAPRIRHLVDFRTVGNISLIIIGLILIAVFSFVKIDLSLLGGDGSFHIIPKSLGAILIFVVFFRAYSFKYRLLCYGIVILIFALVSYEDKRDAIFLLLPILLLESIRYTLTIGFKKIMIALVSGTFLLYLIIIMSILRGYGNYNPKGFLDATSYVDDYVQADFFIPAFLNNIEVSYVYFHSNNSIEQIVRNPERISYGSTLIKPLFIVIPRKYMAKKPDSIIELYTSTFSRKMREQGVSWPISIQSEMFWNFHYFGFIAVGIIFFFFNCVYKNLTALIQSDNVINYIPLLYLYQQLLVLFRGSGLDQYVIDIVLSIFMFTVLKFIVGILVNKKSLSTL